MTENSWFAYLRNARYCVRFYSWLLVEIFQKVLSTIRYKITGVLFEFFSSFFFMNYLAIMISIAANVHWLHGLSFYFVYFIYKKYMYEVME